MPQMAPMSWLMIYMIIIMLLLLSMNKIYFNMNKMNNKNYKMKYQKKMNWKW
uniref:ATP synthase F0 subunit 8 n=1 Tax=Stheneboea repudiosa TaxID=2779127 RepID=UPI0025A96042|nr:ATP synthase F0 subunit 8 [Stheneboea repudiosa]WID87123.1 ATP synthase F0 subunit 8 [Stheneboea repudiosa]